MTLTAELLFRIAVDHGTPAYVYSADLVERRVRELADGTADRFELAYAVKANPNPSLLELLRTLVDRADVSSAGEVAAATAAGWPPASIGFTGPVKGRAELEAAVEAGVGTIVLESLEEAVELDRIARRRRSRQAVLLRATPHRLPPGYGLRLAGRPSPFGVDEEELAAVAAAVSRLPGLELVGFHAYPGSQCLDAAAVVSTMTDMARLFRDASMAVGLRPKLLVFGPGLGVACHPGDQRLDLDVVAAGLGPVADGLRGDPVTSSAAAVLELGRFLVAEAGVYLLRVRRVKTSRGTRFALCDGGMHHHLAAGGHLGGPLARTYAIAKVGGDLDAPPRRYDVAGPLCTSLDVLARNAELPELAPGDVLAVPASGAYGLTASPVHFLSHPTPRELMVQGDEVRDVTSPGIRPRRIR